jgi:putative ATPase
LFLERGGKSAPGEGMESKASAPSARIPLAERLRPSSIDEVAGQKALLGPGKPLRMAFEAGKPRSFILWGPPGVGKTTIGRLAAQAWGARFAQISAATAGVKDIRDEVDKAQKSLDEGGPPTALFVDEIHRFNKGQQDALLPHVEAGTLALIGATTEHPGLSVNNALLSRSQLYELAPLSALDMEALFERARDALASSFDPEALSLLMERADGDGRRFLGLLEQVDDAAAQQKAPRVDAPFAAAAASIALKRFDKEGDSHHEQLSAFHKSLRGSSPDGALYWLARMLEAGVDPKHICRRMVAMASEDVGNADPDALGMAVGATLAYERLGSPEGELNLAQAAVYLAMAPKSNAVYAAWSAAKARVRSEGTRPVPLHLRNAPTKLMSQMGAGVDYRYAHDEPGGYAAGQGYLPEGMAEPHWYRPTERGMEKRMAEKLQRLRELDRQARGGS